MPRSPRKRPTAHPCAVVVGGALRLAFLAVALWVLAFAWVFGLVFDGEGRR